MSGTFEHLPFVFNAATTLGQVRHFQQMFADEPRTLQVIDRLVELTVGPFHTWPRGRQTA